MALNETEAEERRHLAETLARLREALQETEARLDDARSGVLEAKRYVWANRDQLDPAERAANAVDISLAVDRGERDASKRERMRKQLASPYFGRVDFTPDGRTAAETYYIGVHAFGDADDGADLVYDWRSPVASLFYDSPVGQARYAALAGEIAGRVGLKRQYRIERGEMAYMLESAERIHDEVLQRELSRTSDEKMKQIAATIQAEQNAIIRNERANVLIVQGVAGSGKTSVALHRIAYMLYRRKETLRSANVMILSPNRVFADFISNVLPELGEERIAETSAADIASRELAGICDFETFAEQLAAQAAGSDEALAGRIRFKAGIAFVHALDDYAAHLEADGFAAEAIAFGDAEIGETAVAEAYRAASALPVKARLAKTAAVLAAQGRTVHGDKLKPAAANRIKTAVRRMFRTLDPLALYRDFYVYIGAPEMFKPKAKKKIEYADVYPLLYLKLLLEGATGYEEVKHLVIDEMQDYTAVHFAVLARLFACGMTIVGDENQSLDPNASSTLDTLRAVFPAAQTAELLKSYRSTAEIIAFARRIAPGSRIEPAERHGEQPMVVRAADEAEEIVRIGDAVAAFQSSGHRTLGIVCKTEAQAERLHAALLARHPGVHRLGFGSAGFREGAVVLPVHVAKGLEFDRVVVPFANAETYRTEADRGLLYIACTRALHELALTFSGSLSPFAQTEVRP
ncbi:DNA helicase-2 / ATP-dependent DNA helicase PcrA [Paenibacillus sp. UNC496MF]|uniref:HelD family protein n=1 Tax=Paenibacillus sp. UNC496MF TaxID=1502753 RepID=UPI0008EE6066|nr:AAA family ATPase [Paenibacillus sp. UNC496MF]SFJ13476.1 DNA helicase-2 / ATP-dependent DNA helicase PcrA [Paenibacillus sp. UNC496MF]